MSRSVAAAAVYSALSVWVACFGGVLQRWSCETSEISEHEITAYHGETIDMQCQMLSYGRVVSGCGVGEFLWQTNGMGSAWWKTNATCSSGYVKFWWTPEFDTGADDVRFFFRVTDAKGANYRANGTVRLLGSPYGDARYLPLPQKVIDFNQVTILNPTNAPWQIKGDGIVTPNQVTNIASRVVTNDVASWALKPSASPVFVEKDPTVGLTNSTVYASGTNVTFLTEHQSLSFTNGYRRIDDKINWLDVTNHSDFVTESVTNGLVGTTDFDTATNSIGLALSLSSAKSNTVDGVVFRQVEIGAGAFAPDAADGTQSGRRQSIAIGLNAKAYGGASIAIGGGGSSSGGIPSGAYIMSNTAESVSIGYNNKVFGSRTVSIGPRTVASNTYDVVIGAYAHSKGRGSITVGSFATNTAEGAVLIGSGVNTNANTFQFKSTMLVDEDGRIPCDSVWYTNKTERQIVDYIDTDGTQWINLDLPLRSDYKVEISVTMPFRYRRFGVFGNRSSSPNKYSILMNNQNVVFNYGNGSTTSVLDTWASTNRLDFVTRGTSVVNNYKELMVSNRNSNVSVVSSPIYRPEFESQTDNMFLFWNNEAASSCMACRFYYAKIYKRGELVRDLVPYFDGSSYCIKDMTSGRLFFATNENAKAFSGPGIAKSLTLRRYLDAYLKDDIAAVAEKAIDHTSVRFSNEVLSVGLGIDTNSVAVLNEIAASLGGFPLSTGETATTVGGLILALAAAVAWLKKNKASISHASTHRTGGEDVVTLEQSQITGLGDALAAKRDKTDLIYGEWTYNPSISSVGGRLVWMDGEVVERGWSATDATGAMSEPKGDENSISLSWTDTEWPGGIAFTATRQRILTTGDIDATPTSGHTNPVQSGGVATALAGKATQSDITSAITTHNASDAAHGTKFGAKADKVASPTAGDFAALDANGNLIDSTKNASSFDAAGTAASAVANDVTHAKGASAGGQTATSINANGILDVSSLFTSANTSLGAEIVRKCDAEGYLKSHQQMRYAIGASSSATMADRTINQYAMSADTELVFPTSVSDYARDFLLKLTYTSGTMTLPSGVTKVGDDLSFTGGKTYLMTFTEIAANQFYVRSIEIA